jgi:peptidoglycan/LPS O-acetylase OafA/YrhL
MWYILLFVAQPPCKSVIDAALKTLAYFFSQESENRKLFIWLVVLPIICCVLAAAYLLGGARSRNGALLLLIAGAALAFATVLLRQSISTILPIFWAVYWGWRSYAQTKKEHDVVV